MQIQIKDKHYKQIKEIVKHMNDINFDDFVENALYSAIKPYLNEEHEIKFIPATLDTGEKCYVLKQTKIFKKDYLVILSDNQLLKVPKAMVVYDA